MVPCALHPLYPAAVSNLSLATGCQGRLRRGASRAPGMGDGDSGPRGGRRPHGQDSWLWRETPGSMFQLSTY